MRTPRSWGFAADLSDAASLDRLSHAMGARGADNMSSVMAGSYRGRRGGAPDWCWRGCEPHVPLIEAVRQRFTADITALRRLGLKVRARAGVWRGNGWGGRDRK